MRSKDDEVHRVRQCPLANSGSRRYVVNSARPAGSEATLEALLVAVGLAFVIVLPALGYLYKLNQSESWSRNAG